LETVDFQEISGYEVIRQLGAGGMGQVFLVPHPRLPRRDAMKLLDPGVSRNDEFKIRFRRGRPVSHGSNS
jgi:serine/threonine protein kinase